MHFLFQFLASGSNWWISKITYFIIYNFFQVLFSDESYFEVGGQRTQFVRRSIGEPVGADHIQQRVKHPEKAMFWCCLGFYGGLLVEVDGMMNSEKYIDILQNYAIPQLQEQFFGQGVFQQDLAPCHTSKMVSRFMTEQKIRVLAWPGNSPDMNPIENLWSIVKHKLHQKDCSNKLQLTEAIADIWENGADWETVNQKLVNSMPNRVKMLLKAKGGHTKY